MLARGEVEEVIVRPDLNQVTIVLHEGAVVKGRRVEFNVFQMNVADVHVFEEKLREAETKIGEDVCSTGGTWGGIGFANELKYMYLC